MTFDSGHCRCCGRWGSVPAMWPRPWVPRATTTGSKCSHSGECEALASTTTSRAEVGRPV